MNLIMLCFLQAVLGFDNLLYISIESQRAPVAQQKAVRFWGIIIDVPEHKFMVMECVHTSCLYIRERTNTSRLDFRERRDTQHQSQQINATDHRRTFSIS